MTVLLVRRDADAGVAHGERDGAAGRELTRAATPAPRVGELERVRQQVLQDLPEPLRVGLDALRRARLDDDVEAQLLLPRHRLERA